MLSFFQTLFILVVTAISVDTDSHYFCQQWYPNELDTCYANIVSSLEYVTNSMYIQNKKDHTPSLCSSFYVNWERSSYRQHMTMAHEEHIPSIGSSSHLGPDDFSNCSPLSVFNRDYPFLEDPIPSSVQHFVHYDIDGILNLMQIRLYQKNPQWSLRLSRKQLIDELGEYASPTTILDHLKVTGVCTESEYDDAPVSELSQADYSCTRFKIQSYEKLRITSSCKLAREVEKRALFVEVALEPYHCQLYSPRCSETPLDKAYYCMTYAGVVTGFDYSSAHPFFSLYISRHGDDKNRVNVRMSSQFPFASIISSVYDLTVDEPNSIPCGRTPHHHFHGCILSIPDNCFNEPMWSTLDLSQFSCIKQCIVGKKSFRRVLSINANNIPLLESFEADEDSFSLADRDNNDNLISSSANRIRALNEHRSLNIHSCSSLKTLKIHRGSMSDYLVFNVTNVDTLEDIQIGEAIPYSGESSWSYCFYYASNMLFDHMPKVKSFVLGNGVSPHIAVGKFYYLDNLEELTFGYHAWYGISSTTKVYLWHLQGLKKFNVDTAMTNCDILNLSHIGSTNPDILLNAQFGAGKTEKEESERSFGRLRVVLRQSEVNRQLLDELERVATFTYDNMYL